MTVRIHTANTAQGISCSKLKLSMLYLSMNHENNLRQYSIVPVEITKNIVFCCNVRIPVALYTLPEFHVVLS